MTATIPVTRFTAELFALLEETFEKVEGRYLDRGTSLFETLAIYLRRGGVAPDLGALREHRRAGGPYDLLPGGYRALHSWHA